MEKKKFTYATKDKVVYTMTGLSLQIKNNSKKKGKKTKEEQNIVRVQMNLQMAAG